MKNGKVCSECKKRSSLSYIISCGVYAHPLLQETIKQWKFGASFDITYFLGELMQKTIRENYFYEWLEKYQPILIPIPIHKRKLNIRGFNQTEALANFLSEYNGLKVCSNVLLKVKNTRPQTSIPHNKRWQNIKNSYQIKNPSLVEGKNILLVDDVVTTGATLKHATYLLKKAGAKNISAVTLAFGNP
ncbi:MAG: ComF family protein [bacterium]